MGNRLQHLSDKLSFGANGYIGQILQFSHLSRRILSYGTVGTECKDDEVEFPTYLANLEYGHWHVEQQRMQDKHFPSLMNVAGYVH